MVLARPLASGPHAGGPVGVRQGAECLPCVRERNPAIAGLARLPGPRRRHPVAKETRPCCNKRGSLPSSLVTKEVPLRTAVAMKEPETIMQPGLERVFETWHGMVFRTAYRITGNAADAEDVLQTVFLRLAGRDASAAVVENEESYLRRAAVNASLDVVRARHTAGTVPLENLPTSASCTELRELRDTLRRALGRLI